MTTTAKRTVRAARLRAMKLRRVVATRRLLCGASVAGIALGSQAAYGQTSVVAGSTHTQVSQTGDNTVVITNNADTARKIAFNRFNAFTVGQANTVDLVLPDKVETLVNVVNSGVAINGTVNSRIGSATGGVGGNLYFMTSGGLIVGATGSINTGRLIVRGTSATAAQNDTDSFLGNAGAFSLLNYGKTSSIEINGRINAPGGVDLFADTVKLGATGRINTGQAAADDIVVRAPKAMVSTVGLTEGAALVKVNGGIAIVGVDEVTFAAGSTLDARAATVGTVAMPGGIDIGSAGAIKLGGTLTAWDGTSATAADIKVKASKAVEIASGFSGLTETLLGDYYKKSTADTSLSVTGTIVGGTVSLTADASASTKPDADAVATSAGLLKGLLVGKLLEKVGLGLDVIVTRAAATSAVTIGSGAAVTAAGDLEVSATSTAEADGTAKARLAGKNAASFALAVGVAQVTSTANVTVDGALKAGGAVTVAASNDASSSLDVLAKSTKDAKAGAVAYTEANVAAGVKVGGRIEGKSVAVTAANAQGDGDAGFDTNAKVVAYDGSPGGGAGAVTKLDIASTVDVTGTIVGGATKESVTISATTATNHVVNKGESVVGENDAGDPGEKVGLLKSATKGDTEGLLFELGAFDAAYKNIVGGNDEASTGDSAKDGSATRVGAAVAVLFDTQKAVVNTTGTITAGGLVAVDAKVADASVRNIARAETSAEKDVDGAATTIAGAAAWSKANYTSTAKVGGTVTADGLAVNANTERARGEHLDLDAPTAPSGSTEDVLGWAQDLYAKSDPILKVEEGFFGSAAGATAKTDSAKNAAISGSVSYADVVATTRAEIAPLAKLTLGGPLVVDAVSKITMMNLSGVVPVADKTIFATEGGKGAAGIVVTYSGVAPTTVAAIGKGVTLDRKTGAAAVDVNVDARSDVALMTLAPQAGQSNGITGSGTFASNNVAGKTAATISKDARLDLGTSKLTLGALSHLELWAVGGSIAYTKADGSSGGKTAGSIGVSGALNYVDFDTRARVTADGDAAVDTAAATPGITAGDVAITADTTGSINALSVAGAVTDTSKAKPGEKADESKEGSQTASKPVGTSQAAKDKLRTASAAISNPVAAATKDLNEQTDTATADIPGADAAKSGDAASKGTVTKGFGVAGSASVNLSSLTTRVETTGAKFFRATGAPAATSTLLARASEGVDLMAVTGAASIVKGSGDTKGNILVSGAYGLSATDNVTSALVSGTTATGFGQVAVQAASNGMRVSAGLALSVDTTKDKDGKLVAGSVSHLIANDGAVANMTDSNLTGTGTSAGKVDVLAYNGLRLAAGAGGLTAGKGKGAGGAATVIQVGSPTGGAAGATLVNTVVSDFGSLSVRGLTAARIIGAAAAGAISTDKSGAALSAALSLNLVSLDSVALIDTGADGRGKITVGGAVNVYAGDIAQGQAESVATQGRTANTAASSIFSDFAIGSADFSGDDPIRAEDLKGGTQILSIAVPLSAAKGNAAGIGFAWNSIDNDRTAGIVGGSTGTTPTITAGSVSVQATDHSDILALGVGVGASSSGVGLMGSVSRNLIEGSSSAAIGRSVATGSNLSIKITGPVGATPNLSVGTAADGGIWSLAGAVGIGKGTAAGLSVGVNDIIRTKAAANGAVVPTDAGLRASIDGLALDGTPDVDVAATTRGRITAYGIAVAAATKGNAVAGAATANQIAPTIAASASGLNYLTTSAGDLKIRARDESAIQSTAIVAGLGKDGGVAAGVSVNRIDVDVSAAMKTAVGDHVLVRNLLVDTSSVAATRAFGMGAGGGKSFGGAGSIAVNLTNSDVSSLLTYTGGEIATTGSIGVVAKRDLTIDVGAGALAGAASGAAIGASVIVNDLGGSADARIVGNPANMGTITAFTGADAASSALSGLRTGALDASLPQFDGLDGFKNLTLAAMVKPSTAAFKGVAVNAASTAATRTIAITGAIAGSGAAIGVTGVVNNVTGTTNASITDANVKAGGTTANDGVGIDVRASSQQVGVTFAGALAGAGSVAVSAPIVSDGYAGTTSALVRGGTLTSAGAIAVKAIANQSSTALAAAGAVGGSVAAAVAAVSPRFASTTTATIDRPTALTALGTDGVAVNADANSRALATFVAAAGSGSGAGAGAVVVATNENVTSASYIGARDAATELATAPVSAKKVSILANGDFTAMVAGASTAAAAGVALVGNGVGVVHRGEVTALADALKYDNAAGTVEVKAKEQVAIAPVVGQVAIAVTPASAGAALGVIAILGQSKVDATISRPSILNAKNVIVDAKGYNQINALQLGVAVGGVGLGANVTYIGIGKVTDTGALTATADGGSSDSKTASDQKVAQSTGSTGSGNSNLSQLSSGGSKNASFIAGQTGNRTSSGERDAAAGNAAARTAFTQVAAPGDTAESRVRAQAIGGGTNSLFKLNATNLTIDSDANLLSKSTNAQVTAGVAAGSATVGITRNAAQSIAQINGVIATGGTLQVNATTGEAAGTNGIDLKLAKAPTMAAEANIYAGTVGVGALSVGVADVKLQSAAVARSDGAIGFDTATVKAEDLTSAKTFAVGAVAGGAAVNVVLSNAAKDGTVAAIMSGASTSKNLNILANGLGGASAEAYAGSGGLIFAGNAAVALATDTRNIAATIAEGARILAPALSAIGKTTVAATSTPLVTARSFGVAISGGIAAGASVATATSAGTVSAMVGEGGQIYGALEVTAQSRKPTDGTVNVYANASGSAGGYLAAANGAVAKADTTLTTQAVVGANLAGQSGTALLQAGKLTVTAKRELAQYSEATGITAAGVLAVGIQRAEANSSGTTRAALENVDGSQRMGVLLVSGAGTDFDAAISSAAYDFNQAKVTAGAGGLGAGLAADAVTNTSGTAITEILTPTDKPFYANAFAATALYQADYRANSDSTLATLAGGSGTTNTNTVTSKATVNVGRTGTSGAAGANSVVQADTIAIKALAQLKNSDGGAAKGAGGGVVTGQAAGIVNRIDQAANVSLRNGLTLRQAGGDIRLNEQGTMIDAAVEQGHSHSVTLDVGGIMQVPHAEIDGAYKAAATVDVGDNILIRGDRGIALGTLIQQTFTDTAAVQIYGLAGVGGGSINNATTAAGTINIGNNSTLETFGDITVRAGKEARGVQSDVYNLTSQTDVFNNTILPISTDQGANSTVVAHNTLNIGQATLRAARDLVIGSESGAVAASAAGTGHNPYLKLLSIETKGGTATSKVDGTVNLTNAALTAGFLNDRKITVDPLSDANAVSTLDGVARPDLFGDVKGLAVTTNNALYNNGKPDSDWLGKFDISAGLYDAKKNLDDQIAKLEKTATDLGLTLPKDPNSIAKSTANYNAVVQAARKALIEASAKSGTIASLGTLYETRQALVDAGVTAPTKSIVIGGVLTGGVIGGAGVFAAGGRVSLAADTINSSGSTAIKALGGAKVEVVNNTNIDTVIGNVFVPFKVNGAIDFTGKAEAINGLNLGTLPTVYDSLVKVSTVDNSYTKSDIIVAGSVQNIGGAFKASTPKGNYIQFGAVNVASFSSSSPNGLFTVSLGNGTFSQGLPLAFYTNMSSTLGLYTGRTTPTDTAQYVASYIASQWLGTAGTVNDPNYFGSGLSKNAYAYIAKYGSFPGDLLTSLYMTNDHKLASNGQRGLVKDNEAADAGFTFFGGCSTTCTFAPAGGSGAPSGRTAVYAYDGDSDAVYRDDWVHPVSVSYRDTTLVSNTTGGTYGAKTSSDDLGEATITATQVIIDAKYVDISGTIKAGPVKERSLTIGDGTTVFDKSRATAYTDQPVYQRYADGTIVYGRYYDPITDERKNGPIILRYERVATDWARVSLDTALAGAVIKGGNGIDLKQGFTSTYTDNGQTYTGTFDAIAGGSNLGAQFIRETQDGGGIGYIKVDDVVAAGGGKITITGKILNTNPVGGGMLQVLNGFGNVSVDNASKYDLRIGTINAGLSAEGRITLNDTGTGTTIYENTVGGQVTRTFSAASGGSSSETYSNNVGLQNGGVLTYNPTGKVYYVWADHQSIERGVVGEDCASTTITCNSGYRSVTDSEQDGDKGIDRLQVSAWADVSKNKQGAQLGKFLDLDPNNPVSSYDTTDLALTGLSSASGAAASDAARLRLALGSSSNDAFVQIIDGKVTRALDYYFTDSDDNDDGFRLDLPTAAELNVLSAAKATNPIRIMFDQGTGNGGINIRSTGSGKINLTGTLTYGGGTTLIDSKSSIVADAKSLVLSRNIELKAADSIGTIYKQTDAGTVLSQEAAFKANLLGGYISADSGGSINLALKSGATTASGESAPILIKAVRAGGDVKIASDGSLAGLADSRVDYNIRTETGTVRLDAGGSITGNVTLYDADQFGIGTDGKTVRIAAKGDVQSTNYYGAGNIGSAALKIDMKDSSLLTIVAQGDVAIQQGSGFGTGTDRQLRIGSIETSGDVLIKAWGSIVAGDPTATVDQAKLDRFLAAAKALQLAPDCATNCGIVDPAALGGVDQVIRAEAYAAYDVFSSTGADSAEYLAAKATLTKTFGAVPSSRGAISTAAIKLSREDQIAYQLRNQGRDAYDLYVLTNAGADADGNRTKAVGQTLTALDAMNALVGKGGVKLTGNGATVTVTDASAAALQPGGELYQIAVSALAAKNQALASGVASTAEIEQGLALYVAGLRAPVAALLPTITIDLNGIGDAARGGVLSARITDAAIASWVAAQNLDASGGAQTTRQLAVSKTLSAIDQIAALKGKGGVSLSTDGASIVSLDVTATALKPGGDLYMLALATLKAKGQAPAGSTATTAELQNGLQLYLTDVRTPVASLLPAASADIAATITQLTDVGSAARKGAVSNAIGAATLTAWVDAQNVVAQRARVATDALAKVEQLQSFTGNAGIVLAYDATAKKTVLSVSPASFASNAAYQKGGELYELGVTTLRAKADPVTGLRNKIPLPTQQDVIDGLQLYYDQLRAPIADLLPTTLPVLTGLDTLGKLKAVSDAITSDALATWAGTQQAAAVANLTTLFGAVPITRTAIGTATLVGLAKRTEGAKWSQTMLDVQVPSTAFVPVADSQIEFRAPVISARGVTLVAGNSIGAFDGQKTFTYGNAVKVGDTVKTGYLGATDASGANANVSEQLAAAYLGSSGPGDLKTEITYLDPKRPELGIVSVAFTTRRNQPLQLAASGIVNAIAGVNIGSIAGNGSSLGNDRTTVASNGSGVGGDIFVNNAQAMTIGTILSAKTRDSTTANVLCNLGGVGTTSCDSRVRLVAPDIKGVTANAAKVVVGGQELSNGGSSIIMGGLVRVEASNGSIQGPNGSAIAVDTRALEVLRAAHDITLIDRGSRAIAKPTGGSYGFGSTSYAGVSDLQLGDVFAGGRLTIDNPYGSLFVVGVASNLESENRNTRIVSSILQLRAAGDIGSTVPTSAGKVGQFDIQSPIIQRLASGWDYATGTFGAFGAAPAGLGTGSTYFALRGVAQIGAPVGTEIRANSLLGARGNITVGTLNNATDRTAPIRSVVTFLTDINVGGRMFFTTDGDIEFPDETVRITGLGITQDPNTVDLSRLDLNLKGAFKYINSKNVRLGSLTAGGGFIQSREGWVEVNGTIFGNGGADLPFEINGKRGVTVGSTGQGSVKLVSELGDVRVNGQTTATDLIIKGVNVAVAGGIYGRSADITAGAGGTVSIGGSVLLQRTAYDPKATDLKKSAADAAIASKFLLSGGALSLSGLVQAQDAVTVSGRSITTTGRSTFLNTAALTLTATGALNLAPTTSMVNVETARLTSGAAAAGGSTVALTGFTGGSLAIFAPVGIGLGNVTTTSGVTLATAGALALNGSLAAGGIVDASAKTIVFGAGSLGVRDATAITIAATDTITAGSKISLLSRGIVTVATRDTLVLDAVTATGGSIGVSGGDFTLGGAFASNGADYRINAGGSATFVGSLALAGNLSLTTGKDLTLAGPVALNGASNAALSLTAGGALVTKPATQITARANNASVRIVSDSVAMDAASQIVGAAVTLRATGSATLGNILANQAAGQAVTLRAGYVSVGQITAGATTISALSGQATLRSAVDATDLTVGARDDLSTNGIRATSATLVSTLGAITLGNYTRVVPSGASNVGATLSATAATQLSIAGPTSAAGGMALTAPSVTTSASGYISDGDGIGAVTAIRADTVNVRFDTGNSTGPAIRVDARGLSQANIDTATFRFATARPVTFDTLWVNKGTIAGTSALKLVDQKVRDYLNTDANASTGSTGTTGSTTTPASGSSTGSSSGAASGSGTAPASGSSSTGGTAEASTPAPAPTPARSRTR